MKLARGKLMLIAIGLIFGGLSGCSSQNQSPPTAMVAKPAPVASPTAKPPFHILNLSQTPIYLRNGEVNIDFQGGNDPYITDVHVLAMVLWTDKKSQLFRLNRIQVFLGSQINSTMRYDRRRKTLTYSWWSSMAGPGMLDKGRTVCRNVTDAAIFKTAAVGVKGDLKQFGCTCHTTSTDLLKSKRHRK